MNIREDHPRSKPAATTPRSFSPTDAPPVPPHLRLAPQKALTWRLRLRWADPTRRSGEFEEIVRFGDPVAAADLLRDVTMKPDRVLLAVTVEVKRAPFWETVHADYLHWRAQQRIRRRELAAQMEKRRAERAAAKGGA